MFNQNKKKIISLIFSWSHIRIVTFYWETRNEYNNFSDGKIRISLSSLIVQKLKGISDLIYSWRVTWHSCSLYLTVYFFYFCIFLLDIPPTVVFSPCLRPVLSPVDPLSSPLVPAPSTILQIQTRSSWVMSRYIFHRQLPIGNFP